jgi:hypothetical protein
MADDRVSLIRRWLMAGEKPAVMVAINASNQQTSVPFRFGDTWISLARTLNAVDPVRLEAYDDAKQLLRATTLASLEIPDPEDVQDEPVQTRNVADMSSSEQMLVTFGELIANAYKHSSEIAWTTAFSKMTEVVDIFARRSEALESRLARMESLVSRSVSQQSEQTDSGGNLLDQMIGAYMSGAAAAQGGGAAPAAPQPTNGKANQI